MADSSTPTPVKILVVNPNSSEAMTAGMEEALKGLNLPDTVTWQTYTGPSACPASINDGDDITASTEAVLSGVRQFADPPEWLRDFDAVLVACYSVHPLVQELRKFQVKDRPLAVTGIFEASVLASLSLLEAPDQKWGIVTTGAFWEKHLSDGVKAFLGQSADQANGKFAGVQTTGLNAGDFHGDIPEEVVHQKLKEATQRLLRSGEVKCVVMGCAGMAGLEDIIRKAAIEEYGQQIGSRVNIVDGVKAGIGLLEQVVKNRRLFQGI